MGGMVRAMGAVLALWGVVVSVLWYRGALPAATRSDRAAETRAVDGDCPELCAGDSSTARAPTPTTENTTGSAPNAPTLPELARYPVCARDEGRPRLTLLSLEPEQPPLVAVHCGHSLHLLSFGAGLERPLRLVTLRRQETTDGKLRLSAPVHASDLDGDGARDLLVATLDAGASGGARHGSLWLLARARGGGFAEPRALLDALPLSLLRRELDGKAPQELLVLNQGERTTAGAAELWTLSAGPSPLRSARRPAPVTSLELEALDLDGDGRDDPAVLSDEPPQLHVWLSSAGDDAEPRSWPLPGARELLAADADGDGKAELYAAGDGLSRLRAGASDSLAPQRLTATAALRDLQLTDADGDGRAQLVAYAHPTLVSLRDAGDGKLSAAPLLRIEGDSMSVLSARLSDLDGDGRADLLLLGFGAGPDGEVELAFGRDTPGKPRWALSQKVAKLADTPLSAHFEVP
ncbi:MAG: VCBS repeat-containing protein [Myxococcales bacterium]|nr:VCBS repeat-containing protein [Myxococcales bacterium]